MKVYFISGLGANKKAFNFLDLSFCEPVFIEWLSPLPKETLEQYAARLRQTIKEEHPVVVGVSFGGMLAAEMAKKDLQMRAIIISSNKSAAEFPGYLRMWKHLPVYNWVPGKTVKLTGRLASSFIGPRGKEQKELFKEILHDSNPSFNSWAIHAILNWNNTVIPSNVIHIHGSADRLLPYRFVKADHVIKNGSHFMVMDRAEELSKLLKEIIIGHVT